VPEIGNDPRARRLLASTIFGTEIKTSNRCLDPFDPVQMKGLKVSDNMNNMIIQEFQYSVEIQSIEVITLEMCEIQFESLVNVIQTRVTQTSSTFANIL
jgi:hypothetical protein